MPVVVPCRCASRPLSSSAGPQVPQEGLPGDALRSALLCTQPQTLGQSVLQAEIDYDLHSSLQVCERLSGGVRGGRIWSPVVGTLPCLASQSVYVPHSPCCSLWTPASAGCAGIAPSPPAAFWTRPSARRPGQAQDKSPLVSTSCALSLGGGSQRRWERPLPEFHPLLGLLTLAPGSCCNPTVQWTEAFPLPAPWLH